MTPVITYISHNQERLSKQNRTLFFHLKKNAKIIQVQDMLSAPKWYTALKVSTDFIEKSITKST